MSAYALIKPLNEVETIYNTIVASPEVAVTYLVENAGEFDYVIDLTNVSPMPGIGWSYDPIGEEFTAPTEDFEAELEEAFTAVSTAIEQAVMAYLAANSIQRSTAVGNVLSSLSVSAPSEEIDLMVLVLEFLQLQAGE